MLEWSSEQDVYSEAFSTEKKIGTYVSDGMPVAENKGYKEYSLAMQLMRTKPKKAIANRNYSNKPPYTRPVRTVV